MSKITIPFDEDGIFKISMSCIVIAFIGCMVALQYLIFSNGGIIVALGFVIILMQGLMLFLLFEINDKGDAFANVISKLNPFKLK